MNRAPTVAEAQWLVLDSHGTPQKVVYAHFAEQLEKRIRALEDANAIAKDEWNTQHAVMEINAKRLRHIYERAGRMLVTPHYTFSEYMQNIDADIDAAERATFGDDAP